MYADEIQGETDVVVYEVVVPVAVTPTKTINIYTYIAINKFKEF